MMPRFGQYLIATGLAAIITLTGCAGPDNYRPRDPSHYPSIGLYPLGPNQAQNAAIAKQRLDRLESEIQNQVDFNRRTDSPPYSGVELPLFRIRLF